MPARILLALDAPDLSIALGQARAAGEAARLGADFLVIGRPITAAADPAAAAGAICREIGIEREALQ